MTFCNVRQLWLQREVMNVYHFVVLVDQHEIGYDSRRHQSVDIGDEDSISDWKVLTVVIAPIMI